MAWTHCRDRLVAIVEGTTPTMKDGGLPAKFKHYPEANPEADTRCFWFEINKIAMKGNFTLGLPRWMRAEIDLCMLYRDVEDPTTVYEAVAADFVALTSRLFQPSNWNQPTSTIESLDGGREQIAETEVELTELGALTRTRLAAEFRET